MGHKTTLLIVAAFAVFSFSILAYPDSAAADFVIVTGISPSSGPAGTVVDIFGSGFTETGNSLTVYNPGLSIWRTFTGITANFSGTKIRFTVPADIPYDPQTTNRFRFQVVNANGVAGVGYAPFFTVTAPGSETGSSLAFPQQTAETLQPSAPTAGVVSLISISPSSGPAGTRVTITGSGFSSTGNTVSVLTPSSGVINFSNIASRESGTKLDVIVPTTFVYDPQTSNRYNFGVTNSSGVSGSAVLSFTLTSGSATAPTPAFTIGDRVRTTDALNVRSAPGGAILGTVPAGALGTIISGPISSGIHTWWQVSYDSPALTGWSAQDWLSRYTAPTAVQPPVTVTPPATTSLLISVSPTSGLVGTVITITNSGTAVFGLTGNTVQIVNSSLQVVQTLTNVSSSNNTITLTVPSSLVAGQTYRFFVMNAAGQGSNQANFAVTSGTVTQPDLIPSSVTVVDTPLANQSFSLQLVIGNIGTVSSPQSTARYTIKNQATNVVVVPASTYAVGILAPGASQISTRTFSLPEGAYIIILEADSNNEITESNEQNNQNQWVFTVTQTATTPAIITITGIIPASGPAGTPVVVTGSGFTATNNKIIVYKPDLSLWREFPGLASESNGTILRITIPSDIPYNSATTNRFYFQVVNGNGTASLGTAYAFTVTPGTPATTANLVVGYVGPVTSSAVYGWACLQGSSAQLPVTIYFNSASPMNVIANVARTEAGFTTNSGCPDILHGFTVPSPLSVGTYNVTATAQNPTTGATVNLTPLSGQTTLTVSAPAVTTSLYISISPTSGPAGSTVTLTSTGSASFSASGNTVQIVNSSLQVVQTLTNVSSSNNTITLTVPSSLVAGQTYRFFVMNAAGQGSNQANFAVTSGAAAISGSVVGYVGPVTSSAVYGWACLQGSSAQLPVTVYFNGSNSANVIANRARVEPGFIANSGCPDTLHGFELQVLSLGLLPGPYSVTAVTQHPVSGAAVNLTQLSGQTTLTIPSPTTTTTTPPPSTTAAAPTVDLKANSSDGPITIPYNTAVTFSWTSSNATSCSSNFGSGSAVSGSAPSGIITVSQTFTITCTGDGGSKSDSVTVNTSSGADLEVVSISPAGPFTVGQSLTFSVVMRNAGGGAMPGSGYDADLMIDYGNDNPTCQGPGSTSSSGCNGYVGGPLSVPNIAPGATFTFSIPWTATCQIFTAPCTNLLRFRVDLPYNLMPESNESNNYITKLITVNSAGTSAVQPSGGNLASILSALKAQLDEIQRLLVLLLR